MRRNDDKLNLLPQPPADCLICVLHSRRLSMSAADNVITTAALLVIFGDFTYPQDESSSGYLKLSTDLHT